MPGWFDGWPGSGTLLKPARKHLPFWLGSKSEITMVSNRVVETVRYERGIFGKPLVPLTQAWAQVVVRSVETGGGDGSAAGLVAGVRGAVSRRRGLRPLAVREALARRVPLPGLRARQGLGAGPGHAARAMRAVPPAEFGDRRDRAAPQPLAAQALVPGGVAGRDTQERHLRPAAWARQLQDRLAAAPQAPASDG